MWLLILLFVSSSGEDIEVEQIEFDSKLTCSVTKTGIGIELRHTDWANKITKGANVYAFDCIKVR